MRNKKCVKKTAKFLALVLTLALAFTSLPAEVFASISTAIGNETAVSYAQKSVVDSVDIYVAQVAQKMDVNSTLDPLLGVGSILAARTSSRTVVFNVPGAPWPSPFGTGTLTITMAIGANVNSAVTPPTRVGHMFTGWFTAPTGGTRVNNVPAGTGTLRLYAQWRQR